MAGADVSRRVGKVVGYPLLSEMSDQRRREFQEALLEADDFEDVQVRTQAAGTWLTPRCAGVSPAVWRLVATV